MSGYREPTEEEIAALAGDYSGLDKAVYENGEGALTPKQRTEKVFIDHSYDAALSIIALAKGAANENTKLRAAQYVCDRALGTIKSADPKGESDADNLEDMAKVFSEAMKKDNR